MRPWDETMAWKELEKRTELSAEVLNEGGGRRVVTAEQLKRCNESHEFHQIWGF